MIPYTQAKNLTFKEVAGGGGTTLTLESMEIISQPTQTSYKVGDIFTLDGLVLYAHYVDGYMLDVTDRASSSIPAGYEFTENDEDVDTVTLSYSEGGVTVTADYGISVIISGLPDGYEEREYIHHTSYTPLNLGRNWGTGTKVEIDIDIIGQGGSGTSNNYTRGIIGANEYASNRNASSTVRVSNANWTSLQVVHNTNSAVTIDIGETLIGRELLVFDCLYGRVFMQKQGAEMKRFSAGTVSNISALNANQPMLLGARVSNNGYLNANFYNIKVYTYDELVAEYVPCLNPSKTGGLYETIGKTFIPLVTGWEISAS